jgi:RNA polymerase sigma factor (sigma-70 family)
VKKMTTNPLVKPECGPGSDGAVWDEISHRWRFPLNDRGREVCEGFMVKYNHRPAQCITGYNGGRFGLIGKAVFVNAMKFLGEDETHSLACEAVVRASAHYDPNQFGCKEEGYTYLVGGIYLALKRAVDVWKYRAGKVKEVQSPTLVQYESADVLDVAEGWADDPAEAAELSDWRRVLDDVGRFLQPRERQVIVCRFRYGWTLLEIGKQLGVSREMVRHIETGALQKLRRAFKQTGYNPNTHEDGTDLPPSRRVRCLRNQSSAVTR